MSFVKNLFSSPSQPSVPSASSVAAAQGSANESTARMQARLNRADTYTPYGSVVHEDLGDDRWKTTQSFSPETQGLFDQQMEIGSGVQDAALNTVGQLPQEQFSLDGIQDFKGGIDYSGLMANPGSGFPGIQHSGGMPPPAGGLPGGQNSGGSPMTLDSYATGAEDAAFNRVWDRLTPQFDDERNTLINEMANKGIVEGSDLYTKTLDNFSRRKNDARIAAGYDAVSQGSGLRSSLLADALTSRQQGLSERYADRDMSNQARQQAINDRLLVRTQPMNELAALLQGSPAINTPQQQAMPQVGVQAPDVTGAYAMQTGGQMNQYNQQIAQQNAGLGGMFGLGSAAIMAG